MSDKGKELLEGAYALASPEDNVAYYRKFADHYDQVFAKDMGFDLPPAVARTYMQLASDSNTPIADLGCGTGIVAECLPEGAVIDGLDISQDMLRVAATKNRYRDLIRIDLTDPGPDMPTGYGAVLSSGAFTHGHLGPAALETALELGRSGCLFVVSINKVHFAALGFDKLINSLATNETIKNLSLPEIPIYTNDTHDHAGDTAIICSFVKA